MTLLHPPCCCSYISSPETRLLKLDHQIRTLLMEISQLIEDPCFNSQWPLNSFDDELNSMNMEAAAVAFGDETQTRHLYAHAPMYNINHYHKPLMEPSPRPSKQLKTSSWNSCITSDQSMLNQNLDYASLTNQATFKKEGTTVSSKTTIGFAYDTSHVQFLNQNYTNKTTTRLDQAHHILAERKRREKLSQSFIALSALIPGLKKMDKASVLGDAIKYLKNLQEKLMALEEHAEKKSCTESVVFVKRYEVLADGGGISSLDENFSNTGPVHDRLPEVEARFSGKDVLIRVHCEKKAGVVQETLTQIQKLHLSVINTTAMTFASYALDITVVAQMDQDFTMTMKDLVKYLRTSLE